jgi:copper chaperone
MARTYRVEGLTCDGCVRAVTRAITRAAPGATVDVDLAAGRVKVDGAAPPERVAEAVAAAGFAFKGEV